MKGNPARQFFLLLVGLLTIALAFHVSYRFVTDIEWNQHMLWQAYIFNLFMAGAAGIVLFRFREKYATSLGFIFFGSSLLKFALFFVFFYPFYHADGDVGKAEFATFFIPYALALIVETRFLVAEMNKM